MFDQIKKLYEAVDGLNKLFDALFCMVSILVPLGIFASQTLGYFTAAGGFLGAVLGYYFTVTQWAGKGRDLCLRRRMLYSILVWPPLALAVATLVVLEPEIAARAHFMKAIREFLLSAMILPNLIIGLAAFFVLYFLVGAITLNSSKLWSYAFP